MKRHISVIYTVAGLTLSQGLLSACATTSGASLETNSAGFGVATKANITAQAITPPDTQKYNTNIPINRDRQTLARKNYRENTVIEPVPVNTTD